MLRDAVDMIYRHRITEYYEPSSVFRYPHATRNSSYLL